MAALPSRRAVAALDRVSTPPLRGVRWEPAERWHVTLRFLGRAEPAAVLAALGTAVLPPATAVLGPSVETLGERVLVVPVAGLDDLARAVVEATTGVGEPPDPRPYRGHLTLARLRRTAAPPDVGLLVGARCAAEFDVDEVAVVASRPGPDGPRYEVVGVAPCGRREEVPENFRDGVDPGGPRS